MNDSRHIERLKRRAVRQRRLTEGFAAFRNIEALKRRALPERTGTDRFYGIGQHHALQGRTAVKGTCSDSGNFVAEMHLPQLNVAAECIVTDLREILRKPDAFQIRQIHKCTCTDFSNRFRNHNRTQPLTAGKRTVVDDGCAGFHDDFLKRIQEGKSVCSNDADTGRNDNLFDAAAGKPAKSVRLNCNIARRNFQRSVFFHCQHGAGTLRKNTGSLIYNLLHRCRACGKQQFLAEIQRRTGAMDKEFHCLGFRKISRQIDGFQRIAVIKAPVLKLFQRRRNCQTFQGAGIAKTAGKKCML